MSGFITAFIYSITAAAFLTFVYDALMIDGPAKKYCAVAVSIVVVALLAAPVVSFLSGEGWDADAAFPDIAYEYQRVDIGEYENFIDEAYKRAG